MTFPPWIRGVRAAAFFLTRVPVGGWPYSDDDWRWSGAHFPLVGAGLGAAYAGVFLLVQGVSPAVAAALVVAAGLLVTGAFHEDGLADTADALGGGSSKERVLEILKDPRIGSFGASALFSVLALKLALLVALAPVATGALIVSQSVARCFPVGLMAAMPYVTMDEAARSRTVTRARWPQVLVAVLWAVAASALGVQLGLGLAAVARGWCFAGAVTAFLAWRFHARTGGVTGDFLGATQQVSEVALLLGFALP